MATTWTREVLLALLVTVPDLLARKLPRRELGRSSTTSFRTVANIAKAKKMFNVLDERATYLSIHFNCL